MKLDADPINTLSGIRERISELLLYCSSGSGGSGSGGVGGSGDLNAHQELSILYELYTSITITTTTTTTTTTTNHQYHCIIDLNDDTCTLSPVELLYTLIIRPLNNYSGRGSGSSSSNIVIIIDSLDSLSSHHHILESIVEMMINDTPHWVSSSVCICVNVL